ncbi:hypothetical protein TcWFU_000655 [Taenia crassiceps]|uniref:Uncharacterized protein n=1 Tax=Taenia crassiceps TaxID=6207 RepID=A0ABR4Q3G5_9CEST
MKLRRSHQLPLLCSPAPYFLSPPPLHRHLEVDANVRVHQHSCGEACFVSNFFLPSSLPVPSFLAQNQCLYPFPSPFLSSRVDRVRSLSVPTSLSLFTPLAKFEYELHLSHSYAHSLTQLHTHAHIMNISRRHANFMMKTFWSPSGVHVRCVAVALVLALFDSLSIVPPPPFLSLRPWVTDAVFEVE